MNPLYIAIPLIAWLALKEDKPKTTKKVKEVKPDEVKEVKPDEVKVETKTGFTLTECDELVINNQDQFQEYNKKLLDTLINTTSYQKSLDASAFKFAQEYLEIFSQKCFDLFTSEIKTSEQFLIIYTLLVKGLDFYINNKFVKADRWKKYFTNEVAFDLYIFAQEQLFTSWAENVYVKQFDQDEFEKLKKVFEVEELPTFDRGFEYDCSSIKVTNDILMLTYFEKIAQIIIKIEPGFSNPETINFKEYCEYVLNLVSPECSAKFSNHEMDGQELLIVYKLFELISKGYMNSVIGLTDEIIQYKIEYFNGQWSFILQDFALPEGVSQEFDNSIKEKGMYP